MTSDINNNLFANIIFSYEKTADEKLTEATDALTFYPNLPENMSRVLEQFEDFAEYLQHEQERMKLDILDLNDSVNPRSPSERDDLYKKIYDAFKVFDLATEFGDQQRLFNAYQTLVDLSEKLNSETLPHLAELGEHTDTLLDANGAISRIYGLLGDACRAAAIKSEGGFFHKGGARGAHLAKLKIYTIDMNTAQQTSLGAKADVLQRLAEGNRAEVNKARALAENISARVASDLGASSAAVDFNNAAPAPEKPLVMDQEVIDAIAALEPNKKSQPRPIVG